MSSQTPNTNSNSPHRTSSNAVSSPSTCTRSATRTSAYFDCTSSFGEVLRAPVRCRILFRNPVRKETAKIGSNKTTIHPFKARVRSRANLICSRIQSSSAPVDAIRSVVDKQQQDEDGGWELMEGEAVEDDWVEVSSSEKTVAEKYITNTKTRKLRGQGYLPNHELVLGSPL